MLINQMAVFTTNRAYEAGELIERAGLNRVETEAASKRSHQVAPGGAASDYLEANRPSKSNIEQSEYVVVTTTNIIRVKFTENQQNLQPKAIRAKRCPRLRGHRSGSDAYY